MAIALFSTVTVGSGGAASIEFTSIPQTGKNALVLFSGRSSTSGGVSSTYLFFNDDRNSLYTFQNLSGYQTNPDATKTGPTSEITVWSNDTYTTANAFSNSSILLSNYTKAFHKQILINTAVENNVNLNTFEWALRQSNAKYESNTAISSIKMQPSSGTFLQYTTASLYIIS